MSDIRDLVESYYNDVYIEEEVEQLNEMGEGQRRQQRLLANKRADAEFDKKYANIINAPKVSNDREGLGPRPVPTVDGNSAANRLPAGKPNLTVKVTAPAPAAAAKVAPTAPAKPAPGTKAAGPESIKPKTPNPLLADKSIERMRQASQIRQQAGAPNITSDMIGAKSTTAPTTPTPQMSARAQALKAGGPSGGPRERR